MDPGHVGGPGQHQDVLCCGCFPAALLPRWMIALLAWDGSPRYEPPRAVPEDGMRAREGGEDEGRRLLGPTGRGKPPRGERGGRVPSGKSRRGSGRQKKGEAGKGWKGEDSEKGGAVGTDEDEDDICPTCLESYQPENPKIFAACGHHFHLACIYAWLERSGTCPVCLQPMKFEELS
ncbi:unnamed protein product [Ostreobium quekettii]|uniref:RING-type E3 ubiquitin transferase n=1 Tax=Ostreobium quekettii TaxID=121088 RepID=A0A8S1IKN0_9CHLO|nr:unnamed protein product [Ostreobium quekettii]|eukprot:evm.model.scf_1.24 EVM.evm.TU.scf_1.24   scf_1:402150-402680(+)